MQVVTLLGATGSIGQQTLNIIAQHPMEYRVLAVTGNTDVAGLLRICQQFNPQIVAMAAPEAAKSLARQVADLKLPTRVLSGEAAIVEVAGLAEADCVVAGIVGAAGLLPILAAIRAGKKVLLANKEPLVMAGELVMQQVKAANATLLPIDSEHNAIFQCLPLGTRTGVKPVGVAKVWLTASGGALRDIPLTELAHATPAQACAHPNWDMGTKVTVDSATMLNKGFEVIEAKHLFALAATEIEVVIHPQSVIHSLVEYDDASMLAQLGNPDMRIPIAHALAWPKRIRSGAKQLNLLQVARLDFQPLDKQRYPCFELALRALEEGGSVPIVLNAANEIAVEAFLQQRLSYAGIYALVNQAMLTLSRQPVTDIETVLAIDAEVRQVAQALIAKLF